MFWYRLLYLRGNNLQYPLSIGLNETYSRFVRFSWKRLLPLTNPTLTPVTVPNALSRLLVKNYYSYYQERNQQIWKEL